MIFEDIFILYGLIYAVRSCYDAMFPSQDMEDKDFQAALMGDTEGRNNYIKRKQGTLALTLFDFCWLIMGLRTPYTIAFVVLIIISILATIAAGRLLMTKPQYVTPYSAVSSFVVLVIIVIIELQHFEVISLPFLY